MVGRWKDDEVLALINIWGDDVIQAQLEGCKRNKLVYEKVSKSMIQAGYPRMAEQCREKVKKLKMEYKKIKDKHRITGTGRKKWKFLEPLEQVLGDKPTTLPPAVIDTLLDATETSHDGELSSGHSCDEHVNPPCDDRSSELSFPSEASSDQSHNDIHIPAPQTMKKTPMKRKKHEDWIEKLFGSMTDKIIQGQADSDGKFFELEEKRLKFEQGEKERAERIRKEEQEVQ